MRRKRRKGDIEERSALFIASYRMALKMRKRIAISMLLLSISLCCALQVCAFSENNTNYTINADGDKSPIPICYVTTGVIDDLGDHGSLKEPEDLFYDGKGHLYIADTGNDRILKCSLDGKVLFEYSGTDEDPLNGPKGVFVSSNEDIYIADTGNNRILHIDKEGKFIKQYVKPDSELLGETLTFDSTKVAVGQTGFLYVLKGKQFIAIDEENVFKGFVGSNTVEFSLKNMLVRMFATKAQKQKLIKVEPDPYANFYMTKEGFLYAVALGSKNQIRCINSVGNNIYPEGNYCENTVTANGTVLTPAIADITVNDFGIVTVVEQNSRRIYQYDQEGNLLAVFGGEGSKLGKFNVPSSIVEDENGKLYILDRAQNNIQIMERTAFIQNVHAALQFYYDGDYNTAKDYWQKVLEIDQNYSFANSGLAKTLYKNEEYELAMEMYKKSDNIKGYSEAFDEYRHLLFRGRFGLVVLVICIIVILVLFIVYKLKKTADKIRNQIYKIEVK